ncbi:MAG: MBL fold metallo-hydrolase [Proteobacteria bacterium]|nr:MBL fold metallo-hydrolase [Pseudomonadota bacterium]
MLQPNTWTRVPGTFEVDIYPIIRKPSIICSSTSILKTPRQMIIVDPGGDVSQIEYIRRIVMQVLREGALPVYIFLTHCHTDHFLAMYPLMDEVVKGQLILHEIAAHALEERDESITMADMIDVTFPACEVYARFFEIATSSSTHPFVLKDSRIVLPDGRSVLVQSFRINEEAIMEVLHTPGHSPDSVSYKIGTYMLTGDLHLATTPGIAGLTGWDNVALATSLEAIIQKAKDDNIELIIPGHGLPFTLEKAEKIFEAVRKEALKLSGLTVLNRARADYLSEYAVVLLEEAGNIFSIIAARLLKVSHYLELLDEEESASEILQSIDTDAIDKMVDEFYYFTAELKERCAVPLISKAVQFSRSVNKIFAPEKISHLFDRFLLNRLNNLLSDFTNVAYGIRFQNQETLFDMNLSVHELFVKLKENPHENISIFESLYDDKQFIKELTRRIAYEPLFSSMWFDFVPSGETALVLADNGIFHDTMSALLEQCAVSGIKIVYLKSLVEEGKAVLQVTDGIKDSALELRASKLSYLGHSMRLAGGSFHRTVIDDIIYYNFELPLLKADNMHV